MSWPFVESEIGRRGERSTHPCHLRLMNDRGGTQPERHVMERSEALRALHDIAVDIATGTAGGPLRFERVTSAKKPTAKNSAAKTSAAAPSAMEIDARHVLSG